MVKRSDYLVRNAKSLRQNQTPWEIKLWQHLRAVRLAGLKFKRQVPVEKIHC
jgi:very-short-patch-repair endonuclease